jgi:hypothetical protein
MNRFMGFCLVLAVAGCSSSGSGDGGTTTGSGTATTGGGTTTTGGTNGGTTGSGDATAACTSYCNHVVGTCAGGPTSGCAAACANYTTMLPITCSDWAAVFNCLAGLPCSDLGIGDAGGNYTALLGCYNQGGCH